MSTQKVPNENTILPGDSAQILSSLPDGSVHCIVTSPPYYQQRDYTTQIQIGNEDTPEEYIAALQRVFRECWRVLRSDGTLWLNLGDKYLDGNLSLSVPPGMSPTLKKGHGFNLRFLRNLRTVFHPL